MSDPRWHVDEDGDLLYGQEGIHYTMCIERQLPGRPSKNRAEAIDALVAAVRSAAEVPALREQLTVAENDRDNLRARLGEVLARLEAWERREHATVYERTAWLHDTGHHADSEHPYQYCPRCEMEHPKGRRAELEARLETAETVIRHMDDGYQILNAGSEGYWWVDRDLGAQRRADIPLTDAEAEAIARARGETP